MSSTLVTTAASTIATTTGMEDVPKINIFNPTPPRLMYALDSDTGAGPSTPTRSTHRLLYRGALSLPDSHLLLDGLTFSASGPVLQNPLALALESMRGRPSLRFMGTVNMKDVWIDTSGSVCMDIHPHASLSHVYFENTFCLSPINSTNGRSNYGVRVALGDSDGLETTQIVIYAQLSSTSSNLILQVARVTPTPPPTSLLRPPRPDDPTPRKPPLHFGSGFSSSFEFSSNSKNRGKGKAKNVSEDETVKHAREVMLFGRVGSTKKGKAKEEVVFKIPKIPPTKAGEDVDMEKSLDDVFGPNTPRERGKISETELEKTNRSMIKKITVHSLERANIGREHSEFKEVFGYVYRGAAFVFRGHIQSKKLDFRSINKAVEAHVNLSSMAFWSTTST